MKTKSELIKKVSKLHKKVAKLQSKIDARPDVPVGKTGVIYEAPESDIEVWCLDFRGVASSIIFRESSWTDVLSSGLLFHDKESAIHAGKVRAIQHKLAGFCAKAWDDVAEVFDWGNRQQSKYHLVYDYVEDRVLLSSSVHTKKSAYFLPSYDLTELRASFTQDELKLALTGEL